jgi:hypothetical protein
VDDLVLVDALERLGNLNRDPQPRSHIPGAAVLYGAAKILPAE